MQVLTNTTREEWIQMDHDDFIKNAVEPLNMMRNEQLKTVISQITYPQFELLASKCWEEQDKQPDESTYDDEEQFREAYDETLPIVILLENITSIRIEIEPDYVRKQKMAKQLALLNIILQPHLFDNVAQKINDRRARQE